LKKQLAQVQAEQKRCGELVDKLTKDVESSEQTDTAYEGVLTAYSEALPNLIKDFRDAQTYSDTKMRMILCAVEKKKPEIDQKIAQYDQQVTAKAAVVEKLKTRKTEAEQRLKQAQQDQEQKAKQYEYWKGLQADIEKKLQEIKDLKKKIEEEDEASHAASMYFLTLELQQTLQSIRIVSPDEFKYKLLTTLRESDEAMSVKRDRERELSTATTDLQAEESELAQMKEQRRDNILKIVATCDEPPDPQKKYQAAK